MCEDKIDAAWDIYVETSCAKLIFPCVKSIDVKDCKHIIATV